MSRRKTFPENLMDAIHPDEILGTSFCSEGMTEDQIYGLLYVISQAITQREALLLRSHYETGESLRFLAEKYALPANRIRQIIRHAIKKLQNKDVLLYVLEGGKTRTKHLAQQIAEQEKIYCSVRKINDTGHLFYGPISGLHLPNHVANALDKAKIQRVRELVILSQYQDGFEKIRQIGALNVKKIEDALASLGLIPVDHKKLSVQPIFQLDREYKAFCNLNSSMEN